MTEHIMTSAELAIWRLLAADLGYEVDECGNPFRRGERLDFVTGETYSGVMDWNPLLDSGDSFALLVHYGLTLCPGKSGMLVYRTYQREEQCWWKGQHVIPLDGDPELAARRAVFLAAGEIAKARAGAGQIASLYGMPGFPKQSEQG